MVEGEVKHRFQRKYKDNISIIINERSGSCRLQHHLVCKKRNGVSLLIIDSPKANSEEADADDRKQPRPVLIDDANKVAAFSAVLLTAPPVVAPLFEFVVDPVCGEVPFVATEQSARG